MKKYKKKYKKKSPYLTRFELETYKEAYEIQKKEDPVNHNLDFDDWIEFFDIEVKIQ